MIKVSREWATPLTIGVFVLMGATGLLMFFHWDNSLQKTLHEWVGWLMVSAVVVHALANWLGFKRYFKPGLALWIMALFALVLAGSFVPWPGGAKKGPSTPGLAIQAVSGAPIRLLAPLYGKTPEQARQALTQAGITLADDEATLTSAIGKDRERLGVALKALAQGDAAAPR